MRPKKNLLRCLTCGKEVLSVAFERICSWCGGKMIFIKNFKVNPKRLRR